MVKIKICGITNSEDALYATRQGADALGFIFYKNSPRYISPVQARAIIKQLPKSVKKVGVFVNMREAAIKKIARSLKLDMLQLHGNESASFCRRFNGFKVIKAFRVKHEIALGDLVRYDVWAYLFDAYRKNKFGGTGKTFDWRLLEALKACKKTIFISGGLTPENVRQALAHLPVNWVDASSSLEKYPGKKDPGKIKEFINRVRSITF